MPREMLRQESQERSHADRGDIVHLCERKDEDGFARVLMSFRPEAVGYLRHYLGRDDGAEDVFQNGLMNALKGFRKGQFDPSKNLRTWFYSVLTNAAIDYNRRGKRHANYMSIDRLHGVQNGDEDVPFSDLLIDGRRPEFDAECNETDEIVRRNVDVLPEPLMAVMKLLYWNGLQYREVAETLHIPIGTVKSRVHAALVHLRQSMRVA